MASHRFVKTLYFHYVFLFTPYLFNQGHYAQIEWSSPGAGPSRPKLLRAADHSKDQAYYLSSMREDQLRHVRDATVRASSASPHPLLAGVISPRRFKKSSGPRTRTPTEVAYSIPQREHGTLLHWPEGITFQRILMYVICTAS